MRVGRGLPALLQRRAAGFERYFRRELATLPGTPPRLASALRYSSWPGGKRIRPLLALSACEAVGADWRRALPAAVALECVHNFSLVHDDLPAMDDDDLRRGRPTTHRRFDEATAILTGDGLLALAFAKLAQPRGNGPAATRLKAIYELARAAGSEALVGGQMLDLQAERRKTAAAAVRRIHRMKTAALIRCALRLGGLAGGATERQLRRLEEVGEEAGLAFQIEDDLMNVRSSAKRLGKRAGTDRARGKATYPAAVGAERAEREARRRMARARRAATSLGSRAARLVELLDYLSGRES